MIYLKSIAAGTFLLIGSVVLLTFAFAALFFLDLRAILGLYPFISVPALLAIFAIGFMWQFRRSSNHGG